MISYKLCAFFGGYGLL